MSGLFDLDADGARAVDEQARLNPLDPSQLTPGAWDGGLDALKGFLRPSAAAGRTLLTLGAVDPIARDAVVSAVSGERTTAFTDRYFGAVDDVGTSAVDYWTPDPAAMGSAAKAINVVGNVAGSVPQMFGAPALFLAQSGTDPAVELVQEGVDAETAMAVGGVNLGVNALGMRLPAAWGTTLTTRVATGAGANVALGVGADAASGAALEAGGYERQAEGFDASDPYARGLDLLMGAAFGWKANVDAPKLMTPTQRDAVLVAKNHDSAQRRTLPGEPVAPGAVNAHRDALAMSIEKVLRGEPVDVSAAIRAEDFMLRPELQPPAERIAGTGRAAVQRDFRAIAEKHGATITSMERPVIARGAGARSQHPHGTAADFRTRDKTPEQVEALMADLRRAGFEVVDERNTDQPHIHAELPPGGRRAQNIANASKETSDAGRALRARLVDDPEQLARDYAALEDSKGGTVLNTDTARELAPEYLADRTRSADVHEAASDTIKTIYETKLAQPTPEGFDRRVLFTAGGTGAGKTTAIADAGDALGRPEIVYDTNMNTLSSAVDKVEQALAAGREVRIAYVYRDPVEALTGGAIPRAQRQAAKFGSGRTVPLEEHARTHAGVRGVMEALAEKYRDDPRVEIAAIDNSHGKGNARVADLESLPRVEENQLRERLQEALEQARTAGLDEALYRGFGAQGRPAQDVGAGADGQPQPQRGEVSPAESPLDAARRVAADTPDAMVVDGFDADGNPRYVSIADALAEIEVERQRAANDALAYPAAVNCFLRRGA